MDRGRLRDGKTLWWVQWALFLSLGACETHTPQEDPDELQPTDACPIGEAQTVEEAEIRAAEVVQCLGHDPEQVAIDCDVTTRWFYLDEMTLNEDGWTIGADTLSCRLRLGEKETVYPFRVDEHRIPESPYISSGTAGIEPDPLDVRNPDARRCRDHIDPYLATYLPNDDLDEATLALKRWLMCGRHQEDDFSLYCWGPIRDSSEFPAFILFLCRIDTHLYRESLLHFQFVGPPPT